MTALIILLCIILILIVLVQIGKVTELTGIIKGDREVLKDNSKWNGWLSIAFLILFLIGTTYSAYYYRNQMLGYGPHSSASAHGSSLDSLFNVTLFFTGIVFVLTHIALFWCAYKFRYKENRKASFISHDNRLEIIWSIVPAVVMTFLVVRGLNAWNTVMADVDPNEDYMEVEATGQQFNWTIRFPGPDGKLGARDFRLSKGTNSTLGIDFTDPKSWDDVVVSDPFMFPKGKKIRVRITAKDVLHNFDLPHFRVKMDAVPGMPTYFIFTPVTTTAEYRSNLSKYPEYNEPFDLAEPNGAKRWEKFDYELACAELCGKGHYSMRRVFKVVEQEEFDAWYKSQKSYYLDEGNKIRNSPEDPNAGKVLPIEVGSRAIAFAAAMEKAMSGEEEKDRTLRLDNVNFETGSSTLTTDSKYELDNLVTALNKYSTGIELSGHTDNIGDPVSNKTLSSARAAAAAKYLIDRGIAASRIKTVGYGDTMPSVANDTPENRAKNRRTEFKILNPILEAEEVE
jgi:cytochrome c oxidase subunit II